MIIFDADLCIMYSSRAAERLFGYSNVEMITLLVGDLLISRIHPAALEAAAFPLARRQVVGRHRDGTTFPFEFELNRVDSGHTPAFVATLRGALAAPGAKSEQHARAGWLKDHSSPPEPSEANIRSSRARQSRAGIADGEAIGTDRWTARSLAWDMDLPGTANGFGLLCATHALRLTQHDRNEDLQSGDLALIDRRVPLLLSGDGWTAHLLELNNHGFGIRTDPGSYRVGTALDGTTPVARIIKALWTIGQDVDQLALADEVIEARMIGLIGSLVRRLVADDRHAHMSSHNATMLERAELIIAAHLTDPAFSAATLAAHMGVSQRHLSSLFAATGTAATKAILTQRLSRAKTLLADPANRRRQIAWIARSSGFDDQNYFARCFRQAEGRTPRQFRDELNTSTEKNKH